MLFDNNQIALYAQGYLLLGVLSVLNSGLPLTAVSEPKDCTTLRYSGIEFAEIRVFFENEFVPDVQSQCLLARSMRN